MAPSTSMDPILGPSMHVWANTHGLESFISRIHQVLESQAMQVNPNDTGPAKIAFDSYHAIPTRYFDRRLDGG